MYITLGPTLPQSKDREACCLSPNVGIAHPIDELDIHEVWWELVRPALIAYGYSEATVDGLVKP